MTIEQAYLDAASDVYRLAKAEHASNLRAEKSEYPAWEAGPVHAFSRAVGQFEALRQLLIGNGDSIWADDLLWLDRFLLRDQARKDAVEEFEQERYGEWSMRMRVERKVPA